MRRTLTTRLLFLVLAVACGEAPGRGTERTPPTPTTTATAPLATLDRVQRIADTPGDTMPLTSATLVLPLASGGILVADTASRRVRRFTREGLAIATIGMPGVGPGQFQSLGALGAVADTVFVWDLELSRLSAFDTTGVLIFTRRAEPQPGALPADAAWAGTGAWLLLDVPDAAGASGQPRPAARLSRWSVGTGAWTRIGQAPEVPLSGVTLTARDAAQLWTARSEGDFWFARADVYAITHYSATGDSLSSIVLGIEARPREILATDQGELWVRIDAPADSAEWHAFDAFGALRYRVRLPATLALLAAAGDTIFAAAREPADGIFFVGRYVARR